MTYLDSTDDPDVLKRRMALLAHALGDVLIAVGLVRADAAMTGPDLLLAADTYCRARKEVKLWSDARLEVGEKTMRDDGRFYIPVTMTPPEPGMSPIVLRVASDAFTNDIDPLLLATEVASRWNAA